MSTEVVLLWAHVKEVSVCVRCSAKGKWLNNTKMVVDFKGDDKPGPMLFKHVGPTRHRRSQTYKIKAMNSIDYGAPPELPPPQSTVWKTPVVRNPRSLIWYAGNS